jgi:hypothetical protein
MLKSTAKKLWGDESGFIVSTDLLLISSILVIGLLVGLVSLRDQIVQELGDVAVAVGNLNQSYSFAGHNVTFAGFTFTVAGSNFADASDFGENGAGEANTDPPNSEPAGIEVSVGATSEN